MTTKRRGIYKFDVREDYGDDHGDVLLSFATEHFAKSYADAQKLATGRTYAVIDRNTGDEIYTTRTAETERRKREADRVDGYDRDDLGESPDF